MYKDAPHERDFEHMEHQNERRPMVSHQSETTPKSVQEEWYGVHEMKGEAMDEAFGLAGKRGCEEENRKAKSQFREYHWA